MLCFVGIFIVCISAKSADTLISFSLDLLIVNLFIFTDLATH